MFEAHMQSLRKRIHPKEYQWNQIICHSRKNMREKKNSVEKQSCGVGIFNPNGNFIEGVRCNQIHSYLGAIVEPSCKPCLTCWTIVIWMKSYFVYDCQNGKIFVN